MPPEPRPIGEHPLRLEEIGEAAAGRLALALDPSPGLAARIEGSVAFVDRALAEGRTVYGLTTGLGASVRVGVDPAVAAALPLNLLRYHGCGTGRLLAPEESAAVLVARLASLARGYSGVRREVLDALLGLLARRVLPAIPEEGSVGASGDLTPLSYVAAVLAGEREVLVGGEVRPTPGALAEAGLAPVALRPKESLAIMNGTSVMSALGALGWLRARRLAAWAATLSGVAVDVLQGNRDHYDPRIFALKPHAGSERAAAWIREAAGQGPAARLQDVYSLRCAPHVLGVLLDALPFARTLLETEIHGVNDNPIIDGDRALHGGNFYGGHPCLATDTLKTAVANVADLLERQLVLLNDPDRNAGLPANLVRRNGADGATHHGFKAMEITASALTAEALKLAGPASVFSRSTESHNQDKVSMGTLSARELRRTLDLTETVAAIHTLALCQAVDLREGAARASQALRDAVRTHVARLDEDRRMDRDIDRVLGAYRSGDLPVAATEGGEAP
ncbi:MAG: histidine ammonia-lyase [Sandaracinaceae bacterium]